MVTHNTPSRNDEDQRLAALQSYQILDTPAEAAFDRITKIASVLLGTPICLISLIDADRQWFKSRQGFDATETPRDIAFCTHTIMRDEVMVVPDALEDPRFSNNVLVQSDPKIRFYAGVPLKSPAGYNVGTLCVIDRKPRQVTITQLEYLKDFAQLAVDEMELRLAGRKALDELKSKQAILMDFEAALSGIDTGVMLLGPNLELQLINDAFCRMWQIPKRFASGSSFLEAVKRLQKTVSVSDLDWKHYIRWHTDLLIEAEQATTELQLSDGRTLECKYIPMSGGGRLLTHMDITERKRSDRLKSERLLSVSDELRTTRAELERVRRLTAMGEMAASIAHEINQPLAAVVTNANAGLRWLASAPPNLIEVQSSLKRIVNDGHRAGVVIESIRALFKKDALRATPIDINELIRQVLMHLRGELEAHGVLVQAELSDGLPNVVADGAQLQQVILNLVMNAAEAMSVNTDRARLLRVTSSKLGYSEVEIAVEDTGPGIDPTNMDRIFESFYTTKSYGMGMGLSICRSIIEAHGGRLSAVNGPRHGAIVQVILPATPATEQ
jgi:signal transduction histidine kinase